MKLKTGATIFVMTAPITGEIWGDRIEEPTAYIAVQSQRPFTELRPALQAARDALSAAIEGVTEAQAAFRPASGEGEDAWGIAEVLRHIGTMDVIFAQRIRQLGKGEPVDVQATYPGFMENVETRDIAELRDILHRSYETLLDAIGAIDGRERLDATDTHRRFGPLNCRGWVVMHTLHIEDHARQIGKIKALTGYPAC